MKHLLNREIGQTHRWLCAVAASLAVLSFLCCRATSAASVPPLSDTINPLPGAAAFGPGTVAINNTTHRVYVVGSRKIYQAQGTLSVIDADTDQVLAGISFPWTIASVVVNEAKNLIYVSTSYGDSANGLQPEVVVVDGATNQVKATFQGASFASNIIGTNAVCDPVTGDIFSIGRDTTTVDVSDGNTLAHITSISLAGMNAYWGAGLHIAINPNAGVRSVYVPGIKTSDNTNTGEVAIINLDSAQLSSEAEVLTSLGAIAVDRTTNNVYVGAYTAGNNGTPAVAVLSASGGVQATLNLNATTDYRVVTGCATLDPGRHRAYFSGDDYAHPEIVAIDTQTNTVTRLSSFATEMVASTANGHVFIAQSGSSAVTYLANVNAIGDVDPSSGGFIRIVTGYRPVQMALNSQTKIVYVADTNAPEILAIDAADHSLHARLKTPSGNTDNTSATSFRGIAVSETFNRVYQTRNSTIDPIAGTRESYLDVFDGATNQLITSVDLGPDFGPGKVAVDDANHHIYVTHSDANGHGELLVLSTDDNSAVGTISNVAAGGFGIAVNAVTHRVYVSGQDPSNNGWSVTIVDGTTNQVVKEVNAGALPGPIAINTNTNKIYVANIGAGSVDNTVTVIDGASDSVETTIDNISTKDGDAVTGVTVDKVTNTVFVGDNGDQAGGPTSINVFDANNGYSHVGKTVVNRYPTGPVFPVFFDSVTRQVLAGDVDDGVIYVLGNTPLGPVPPKPAHGGLSDTVFAVNGLKTAANITSPFLSFTALQTGTPAGLSVRVQVTTTPGDATSWTDLPNGSNGFMIYEVANQQFALVSTNYPFQNGVYFRAVASAGAYPDSISNVVGPFDLTTNLTAPGQTTVVLTQNGVKADFDFKATQTGGPGGAELHVQSSTDPSNPASWADVNDGHTGLMTQGIDPMQYRLLTNNMPAASGVYFRVRATASGALDGFSNILGSYTIRHVTPPVVSISSPANGAGAGQDIDHPVVIKLDSTGAAHFTITATAQSDRLVKVLTVLFDGSPIGGTKDGGTTASVDYTSNVIGYHVIEGVAINDLGAVGRGATGPVYVRIEPATTGMKAERPAGAAQSTADSFGGRVFMLVKDGGRWDDPTSWTDAAGANGIPGPNDVAIVGKLNVTWGLDWTVGALELNGGKIGSSSQAGGLYITKSITIAGGSFENIFLDVAGGAVCNFVNDTDVLFVSSGYPTTVLNRGTLKLHGRGGLVGLTDFENRGVSDFQLPLVPSTLTGPDLAPDARVIDTQQVTQLGSILSSGLPGAGLVAQGGGNLVAQGGGNLVAQGGGNLVAQGGGNLISQDGGGLVAQGGGNLVAQGGGNLVAQGGGNLVAQGGGNFHISNPTGSSSAKMKAATAAGVFMQTAGETNLNRIMITGPVNISGGALTGSGIINGDLTLSGGYVSPGTSNSAGLLAVTGNYTQTDQGTLILEDGGATPDKFDQLIVAKTANVGGKLDLRTINNYQPTTADTFNSFSYGNVSGSFATVSSNAQVTLNPTGMLTSVDVSKPNPAAGQPLNISTRMEVLEGDNVLIAGFIVSGPPGSTKKVMIRGLGPSLASQGVPNPLADPLLELHEADGAVITNDDWQQGDTSQIPTGFSPASTKESVIVATLTVGAQGYSNYTAILKGANGETGVGLAEAYDLDQSSAAKFANISTRGYVETGDNVMIGGFIVGGTEPAKMLVRAIGPSLADQGVPGALQTTSLEVHDANGSVIGNQGWRSAQESDIVATTIPPTNDRDSAVVETLVPGNYTAVVRGLNNTTGVGLVEAYNLQ